MKFFGYKLSHIFRKRYDFKNIEKVRLKLAFEVDGIKYYEPSDLNNFPWQRSLAATFAFNKLQLGVYPDDLQKYFDIVEKLLTGDKFNVVSLVNWKKTNDILKLRMQSPFRPQEMMWDLAAVYFMDETESPYTFDSEYAKKKIAFWKKHKEINLFFSQIPLKRLMPFLPATEENSQLFMETVKELAKIEENISSDTQTNLWSKQQQNLKNLRSRTSAPGTGQNSKK